MQPRKQRNATVTYARTPRTLAQLPPNKSPKVDAGPNTMAKSRFHKKPLCLPLRYMNRSQCKRTNKIKAKDQSLIFGLVLGMMRFLIWINYFIRNDLWDFITTPVDELERMHKTSSISHPRLRNRIQDHPLRKSRSNSWNQVSSERPYRRAFGQHHLC